MCLFYLRSGGKEKSSLGVSIHKVALHTKTKSVPPSRVKNSMVSIYFKTPQVTGRNK